MTTLSHPYKDHPEPRLWPSDKLAEIDAFHDWMQSQKDFPVMSKNIAHLFLHACLWVEKDAKKALQRYMHLRASSAEIFGNRDPLIDSMQAVYNATHMIGLPKLTKEGYRILCYRLSDYDPSKMNFGEAVKAFCMFNDVIISEDGPMEGYIVVFDMKGVRLGHLTRVQFGALRIFMAYIQDAHPVRLKKIYIVHTASFINQVMALVKPLIKSELLQLIKFSTGGPADFFPTELLPEDYGGTLPPIEQFHSEHRKRLETTYREWLIDTNHLKELPKDKDSKSANKYEAPVRAFKALEID